MRLFSRAHEVSSFSNNISRRTLSTLPPPLFLTSIDCDQNCESFATAARNSPAPSSVGPSLRVHACYSKRTRHHHAHPQPVDSIFRWHTNRSSLSTRRGVPLFYISQQSSSFTTSPSCLLPAGYHRNFLCRLFLPALAHRRFLSFSGHPAVVVVVSHVVSFSL